MYHKWYTIFSLATVLCLALSIFTPAIKTDATVALAWHTDQTAESVCIDGEVYIKISFTNTEAEGSGLSMDVVATDIQTGASVDLGTVEPGETKPGQIATGVNSLIRDGTVRFDLRWSDGHPGLDTRRADYSAITCKSSPTPSCTLTSSVHEDGALGHVNIQTVWANAAPDWYMLKFGDGAETGLYGESGNEVRDHVYNPGSYTAAFTINGPGGTTTCNTTITVENPPAAPTCSLTATVLSQEERRVQATVNYENGDLNGWHNLQWGDNTDWGWQGTIGPEIQQHQYVADGDYRISATITGLEGQTAQCSTEVHIEQPAPPPEPEEPSCTLSLAVVNADTHEVKATGSYGKANDWEAILWWDEKDQENNEQFVAFPGADGTFEVPHQYADTGTYNPYLEVTGPGGTTTCTGEVTFEAPPPPPPTTRSQPPASPPVTVVLSTTTVVEPRASVADGHPEYVGDYLGTIEVEDQTYNLYQGGDFDADGDLDLPAVGCVFFNGHIRCHRIQEGSWLQLKEGFKLTLNLNGQTTTWVLKQASCGSYSDSISGPNLNWDIASCYSDSSGWLGISSFELIPLPMGP